MNSKFTALPIILALAAGGCSNQPSYYPNFQACYNDTGDANECLQYIDENGRTSTVDSSNYTDSSQMGSNNDQDDSGIDGSSALTGAAVGAAAGYVAGSSMNNRNNYSDSDRRREDRVYAAGTNTRPVTTTNSNTKTTPVNKNTKTNLSKSTPPKSSTSRGGFGSTGSKSFGG